MDKTLFWGKPNLAIGNISIDPLPMDAACLLNVDGRNSDDGVVFQKPEPLSISFDIPYSRRTVSKLKKLVGWTRIPRKLKKAVKVLLAKKYGVKMKKIKFSMK